jgi:hypothetical protein
VGRFILEMTRYLDSLGVTARLTSGAAWEGTPPDVQFGCVTDAAGDCEEAGESDDPNARPLKLAVTRPSESWVPWARGAMQASDVQSGLLITLEVGQYFTRQRGLRGSKEVQLGTNYTVSAPWVTSLETPVSVLQLTGARIGSDGRAIRAGAEGLFAKRTPFFVSTMGAQALLSPEDVEHARTARREDLPGQPLVWRVALHNLLAQLTGRPELAIR